jgi:hypothetical protein
VVIRRATRWLATVVVAIVVAVALPVGQLRLISIVKECCCPDPAHCHCPDHQPDAPGQPSFRPCHSSAHVVVSPEAPALAAPAVMTAAIPAIAVVAAHHRLPSPHAPPAPSRPDAPS